MLLVDGDNVMGARPDGWWRDRPGAMRRLVQALDVYAANTGADVLVVFDGRPVELAPARVEVRFAPHADDLVAELAGPACVVVTSDRELAARVRARGARVWGAGSLRRGLDPPVRRPVTHGPGEQD